MATLRARIAAVLFAGAALYLLTDASLSAHVIVPLGMSLAYGALTYGVLRERVWSRWLGLGVALSMTLLFALEGEWLLVALHAPLPLLLARPDDAHPRTAVTLLLSGAALVPVLALSSSALLGARPLAWLLVVAGALTIVATIGLARERTWGLAIAGLAGLALVAHPPAVTATIDCACQRAAMSPTHVVETVLGLLLLAAALPFAAPIVRFLRRGA